MFVDYCIFFLNFRLHVILQTSENRFKWRILSETRNQWVLKKNQRSPTNFSSKTNLLLILALCSLYDFMIEKKFLFLCNDPIIWSLKSQACIMKCISIKSQWSVFRPIDISFLLKPYFQVIKPHVQDFFITFNFKKIFNRPFKN